MPKTTITTTTTTLRSAWGGDTSPRVELPRPVTGAAISPTPPDTRRPALPRAHSAAAACAAIQRRAQRQLTAPQASSRPDYRAWCCRRGAARLLVSVAVRSPAGFPQRHHAGRPATRHPHCASLLRCRCGRPAAVFRSPVWQPQRLPRGTATGSHSRRVHAHAIAAPEPACHTALSGDTTRRTCGRPCGRYQSLALGGSRPHPDRYGRRRSFAAAASVSASAPAAASQAPCVPVAHAAASHIPSVAAAAASRRAPATGRRLPHIISCGSPTRGTKPGGLVPLPDPLPQQFNQQSNKQIQIITGRVTHPPAASFRARIQARRSRRLPPIPAAPHCYGLHASAACVRTPCLHRIFR